MTLLLPNLLNVNKLSGRVKDPGTQAAVRNLEDWADQLSQRLARLAVTAADVSGAVLSVSGTGYVTASPTTGNVVVSVSGLSPVGHTHLIADVTGLQAALDDRITEVIAGTNLSGGGSTGSVTLNVIDSPSFAGNVTLGNAATDTHIANGILNVQQLRGKVQTVTTSGAYTLALADDTTIVRMNNAAEGYMIGISGGYDGRVVLFYGSGSAHTAVYYEHAGAAAADRIIVDANGGFRWLYGGGLGMALAIYEGSSSRWRFVHLEGHNSPGGKIIFGDVSITGNTSNNGSITVGGNLTVSQAATLGDASSDAHTVTGTVNFNATAGTNGQILGISGGLPQWGAPSAFSVVDGSGTLNYLPKWTPDGNTLGNSSITDDGAGGVYMPKVGGVGALYLGDSGTGASDTGVKIQSWNDNNVYVSTKAGNGGSLVFNIGHNIESASARTWLTVTGSNANAAFAGNLTVNGNTTLGDATTDITSVSAPVTTPDSLNVGGNGIAVSVANGSQPQLRLVQAGQAEWFFYNPASSTNLNIWSSGGPGVATYWNYTSGLLTHNYSTVLGTNTTTHTHTLSGKTSVTAEYPNNTTAMQAVDGATTDAAITTLVGKLGYINIEGGLFVEPPGTSIPASEAGYGVYGYAHTSWNRNYGVYGYAQGGTNLNYGGKFEAVGPGTGTAYGVYATASGGSTNWAGYFVGDVNITGSLAAGSMTSGGNTVLTTANVSGTANYIPKFTGANSIGNSSWTDDGTTSTTAGSVIVANGVDKQFIIGQDTNDLTDNETGIRLLAWSDGHVYDDRKTHAAGTLKFRVGAGAERGDTRTWLTVTGSNGNATFGANLAVNGNATLGDATTDSHTVNGDLTIIEGAPTAIAASAGTVLRLDQADGTPNYLTMRSNNVAALVFGNGSSGADGGIYYTNSVRGLQIQTAATHRVFIDNTGGVFMGTTANTSASAATALTVGGAVSVTGNATLGDASTDTHTLNGDLTFSNTPTAGPIKYGSANARLFLGRRVITSTSTPAPTAGTKAVLLKMVGGGGGAGGSASGGKSGGGSSGVYYEKWIDLATSVSGNYSVTIGAAGAGSSTTTGGAGGDTSVTINGTTYTARGGPGGAMTSSTAESIVQGGGYNASASSAGDIVFQSPGGYGFTTGTAHIGGTGGSTPLGAGGHGVTSGNGTAGQGYGAGGGGGVDAGVGFTGGSGTAGVVIIEEYA